MIFVSKSFLETPLFNYIQICSKNSKSLLLRHFNLTSISSIFFSFHCLKSLLYVFNFLQSKSKCHLRDFIFELIGKNSANDQLLFSLKKAMALVKLYFSLNLIHRLSTLLHNQVVLDAHCTRTACIRKRQKKLLHSLHFV